MVQDNHYGTWNAYGNQYWPAEYYIDASGEVRHYTFGEVGYARDEQAVRELLRAAGAHQLPPLMTAHAQLRPRTSATHETYLNPHARGSCSRSVRRAFLRRPRTSARRVGVERQLEGRPQSITPAAGNAAVTAHVQARTSTW